jgi:hypothetical protein
VSRRRLPGPGAQFQTASPGVENMPEAGRQKVYGLVIIVMLLAYGRSRPAGA